MDPKELKPKVAIVVRRMWHSPEIHAFIDHEQVGAKMDVQDFAKALVAEIYGDKTRFFSLSKDAAMGLAVVATDKIISEMKSTTGHVV